MFSRDFFAALPKTKIYVAAGVCFVAAAASVAVTQQYGWEETLGAEAQLEFPGQRFSRLWFDGQKRLVAVRETGNGLEWKAIETPADGGAAPKGADWTAGGLIAGPAQGGLWAMDRDATRVAWVADSRLCTAAADGGQPACTALPSGGQPARAVIAGASGSASVVLADGNLHRWTPAGQRWESSPLAVKSVDLATQSPDTLALMSKTDPSLATYRLDQADLPKLVETTRINREPLGLVITAPGQVALKDANSLRWLTQTIEVPGNVTAAAPTPLGILLIAGDFPGLRMLDTDGLETLAAAEADPIAAMASLDSRVAFASERGTFFVRLGKITALSSRGRILMRIASFLASLAVILGLLSSTLGVFVSGKGGPLKRKKKNHTPGPVQLPVPGPEIAAALSAKGGVIWAGAGLSAQSGLPVWKEFQFTLLQSAFYEGWVSSADGTRLNEMAVNGLGDEATDELGKLAAPRRDDVAAHYQSVFDRYATLSEAHRSLMRLPLVGAVTTNFDQILDTMGADEVVLDQSGFKLLECAGKGEFFLAKLYGDPRYKSSILLSREEFRQRCAAKPDLKAAFNGLMEQRVFLFVGASLEGLIHDLAAIGVPPLDHEEVRHWAIAGARGDWESDAATLRKKYGIAAIVCDTDRIASEMPVFLDRLASMFGGAGSPQGASDEVPDDLWLAQEESEDPSRRT